MEITSSDINEQVVKMNQPCKKDCPDRSATCRLSCEKWIQYESERTKEYDRRLEAFNAKNKAYEEYSKQSKRRK